MTEIDNWVRNLPNAIMSRSTSQHEDEAENDEPYDRDNLDKGEPELGCRIERKSVKQSHRDDSGARLPRSTDLKDVSYFYLGPVLQMELTRRKN